MKNTIIILCILGCAGCVSASDWPCWRGSDGDGVSSENNWNPGALKDKFHISWRINIGYGHSAVSVKDEKLYTIGMKKTITNKDTLFQEIVYCICVRTGKIIWYHSYPCTKIEYISLYGGPAATPAIDGCNVYTLSREGDLYCLNTETGSPVWYRNLVQDTLASFPYYWGFCSSPIIADSLLLLNASTSGLVLHKEDGRVIWASNYGIGGLSSPVVFENEGRRMATFTNPDSLIVADMLTGQVQWKYPWYLDLYIDPIIINQYMFIPNKHGCTLLRIDKEKPVLIMKRKGIWCSYFQNFIIQKDHAFGFVGGREGGLHCIHIRSGEVKWKESALRSGALIAADGKLIIISSLGDIIIANASSIKYQEISRANVFSIDDTHTQNRANCWVAPVLSNGRIYLRTSHGDLACIDVSD